MSFELIGAEPLGPGLRRILLDEAGAAATGLESGAGTDLDEAAHEARRSLKKCRAVLRLARPSIGPLYGEANAHLREVGRSLSDVRDQRVLVSTLESLTSDGSVPNVAAPSSSPRPNRWGAGSSPRSPGGSPAAWSAPGRRRDPSRPDRTERRPEQPEP